MPQPNLSLCMIVRDARATLNACLGSVRLWVDEMVVVDTGSKDETPKIAASFGARVAHFPWSDDFSAARNESLRLARGRWLFWMDADDTIDAANGRRVRELAAANHEDSTLGFVIQVHCPGPATDGGENVTVVDHIKLIRNHPEIRFEGRIHEQILPSIRRLAGNVTWTDIHVEHSGADYTPEGRKRKHSRDLRILGRDLEERPNHPFVLFNLGMTYADMGDFAAAAAWLERCVDVSHLEESHLRKAYALWINALSQVGNKEQAERRCNQGQLLFPDDPELMFRRAMLAHEQRRFEEAAACYRRILEPRAERHFTSVDRGIFGYKLRHNLAIVYEDMERPDLAELQWRRVIEERATYIPALVALVRLLIRSGRVEAADVELQRHFPRESYLPEARILRAEWLEAQSLSDKAEDTWRGAAIQFPESAEVLEGWGRFLFQHDNWNEARNVLEHLAQLRPHDAATRHNLGCCLLQLGDWAGAARELRTSLQLRPGHAATTSRLKEVSDQLGNPVKVARVGEIQGPASTRT